VPTKKQRRRREKGRRHEWEEVWVDDEGRELPPEEAAKLEAATAPARRRDGDHAGSAKPAAKSSGFASRAGGRAGRTVQPPSWSRVLKRGAIFAPVMFLVSYYLNRPHGYGTALYTTAFLIVFFVPFSYLMDAMMYRSYQKRLSAGGAAAEKRVGTPQKKRR